MPHDEFGALIQRADLNQRLTKALEIKGHKSPIRLLDPTVVPIVMVEDLTKQAEWVTPTERKLASTADLAGVVGQAGILAITNPLQSGVVAIVERVTAYGVAAAVSFVFGLITPAPVTPEGLYFRDRRVTGAPTVRAFSGTSATLDVVNKYLWWQGSNAISAPWYETDGIVIQPGETFGIECFTQNAACRMSIWLQEIPL